MQGKNENITKTVRFSEIMIQRMRVHVEEYLAEEVSGMVHSKEAKAHMAWRVAALREWDAEIAEQERRGH